MHVDHQIVFIFPAKCRAINASGGQDVTTLNKHSVEHGSGCFKRDGGRFVDRLAGAALKSSWVALSAAIGILGAERPSELGA